MTFRLTPSRNRVLLLVWKVALLSSAATVTTTTASTTASWVEDCRVAGFDPFQLACRTCDLLPLQVQSSCQSCCQSFKDIERLTKPYDVAVLVLPGAGNNNVKVSEEVEQFLKEDWDKLLERKGKEHLQKVQVDPMELMMVQQANNPQRQMMMFYGGGGPSAALYFLSSSSSSTATASVTATKANTVSRDVKELERTAKESVILDSGWKRDDIRDMLETLLP